VVPDELKEDVRTMALEIADRGASPCLLGLQRAPRGVSGFRAWRTTSAAQLSGTEERGDVEVLRQSASPPRSFEVIRMRPFLTWTGSRGRAITRPALVAETLYALLASMPRIGVRHPRRPRRSTWAHGVVDRWPPTRHFCGAASDLAGQPSRIRGVFLACSRAGVCNPSCIDLYGREIVGCSQPGSRLLPAPGWAPMPARRDRDGAS
jgi:hypothetical protein